MKRAAWLCTSFLACVPAAAMAGALYGTVRIGNAPAANIVIVVACPGFSTAVTSVRGVTDANGGYSLNVPAAGRCEMKLEGNGRVGASFAVFVSENPALFNFQIDGAMTKVP